MRFEKAQIVRSLSGHDSGELFIILDVDGDRLLLADGKRRRVSRPKQKNMKHVEYAGGWEHPTFEKVRTGQPVGDNELRKALAQFRDNLEV